MTCHSAVQPALQVLLFRALQFSRRVRVSGACKIYSFVLDLRRPEKRKKITPVMQAEGNPFEKMANFFRERLCILL